VPLPQPSRLLALGQARDLASMLSQAWLAFHFVEWYTKRRGYDVLESLPRIAPGVCGLAASSVSQARHWIACHVTNLETNWPVFVYHEIIEQFEQAWHNGGAPDLRKFVQFANSDTDEEGHRELLEELVMIDIECRWRHAVPAVNRNPSSPDVANFPNVEDYIRRFPILVHGEKLSVDIIAEEYHARQRWGDQPSVLEYFERFPECWSKLRGALERLVKEIVEARVKIYYRGQLVHESVLPALLEIGRQADGEPTPYSIVTSQLGHRLILAPLADRNVSRQHFRCEPCGKERVRVTCTSRKNAVRLGCGDTLSPDQTRILSLPCLVSVSSYAVRIES
jgi:hypothetical protein